MVGGSSDIYRLPSDTWCDWSVARLQCREFGAGLKTGDGCTQRNCRLVRSSRRQVSEKVSISSALVPQVAASRPANSTTSHSTPCDLTTSKPTTVYPRTVCAPWPCLLCLAWQRATNVANTAPQPGLESPRPFINGMTLFSQQKKAGATDVTITVQMPVLSRSCGDSGVLDLIVSWVLAEESS